MCHCARRARGPGGSAALHGNASAYFLGGSWLSQAAPEIRAKKKIIGLRLVDKKKRISIEDCHGKILQMEFNKSCQSGCWMCADWFFVDLKFASKLDHQGLTDVCTPDQRYSWASA